jgi:hypothetical protein
MPKSDIVGASGGHAIIGGERQVSCCSIDPQSGWMDSGLATAKAPTRPGVRIYPPNCAECDGKGRIAGYGRVGVMIGVVEVKDITNYVLNERNNIHQIVDLQLTFDRRVSARRAVGLALARKRVAAQI